MEKDEQNQRFFDAIEFHKSVDKRWGIESPNDSWHPFLIEYHNNRDEFKIFK